MKVVKRFWRSFAGGYFLQINWPLQVRDPRCLLAVRMSMLQEAADKGGSGKVVLLWVWQVGPRERGMRFY